MSDLDDMQSFLDDAGDAVARREAEARPHPRFDDVLERVHSLRPDDAAEGELTGFVADAREGLDRRIDGAPQGASFEDVMKRAHTLRPDTVDPGKLAEAQRLAPVVDLRRHSAGERALAGFVDDARAGVEAKIRARTASASPPRASGTIRLAVAVAAAVLLGVVPFLGAAGVLEAERSTVDDGVEQAQLIEEREPSRGEASRVGPERVEDTRSRVPAAIEIEPAPPLPTVERRVAVERKPAPSLAELAALAKQQWRAGDLAGAEGTLKRIVERGRTSRWADNAFSDLFALAHRRGDAKARQQLWKAYLGRFPRGRFADDAQAGLCRASSRPACWANYLSRFPDGSYRAEAQRRVKDE